ncbi:MAG: transcriptional regulator [Saliniramus fredricksonii]|uniref:Transcriptional regulator n=1 Tax=Saliniramus fredricksonii TaxID=1653334 RepID=A0A0P7X6T6_9HYPH|nr:MarR family winged helix-turn-helix transcriptional regulator [Saliniramus fredricksonii]KPQ10749.1 MAG: transcriptional regulator [Saliniramus fredricksonii]SCC79546.1 DNA-binding transcriptional regulator, MarR family [Saliniramus fredricksonii]
MKHPGEKSVGWVLMRAARLHRARMGEKLVALGLYPGQEQVLQALAGRGAGKDTAKNIVKDETGTDGVNTPAGMSMGELAAILQVRPPTASKTVSRLSAMGLVARQDRDRDGRVVRVALTEAGQDRAEAITGLWDEVEDELLAGLDGKDRKRLRKLLRKVGRNLARLAAADDSALADGDDDEDGDDAVDADSPEAIALASGAPDRDPISA